ncbi:hypothetical protein DEI99_002435 [Curtobacterium sp. MCLR17_036]|uniref:hypothetical protein n=1 Tax=Curtobacterium sp. MCLR17_036 TaxID=2175620 RepID=UPI0011B7BE2F|nr:hypothetical protein [Curtobacterium sp. MCLR17_036]WIE65411.1 hypothetical protein DEI99_002435 [Curtobacterium sp. MCLR17_036]
MSRHPVFLRLLDQGSWSAAFFLFTITASASLDTRDFAALTVVTSIGVIAAACARSFSIDSRVVAGARAGLAIDEATSSGAVALTSGAFAAVATAASAIWIALGSTGVSMLPVALAGLIVLADGPHYLLTLQRRFAAAIIGALPYALCSAIAILSTLSRPWVPVLSVWAAGLVVACAASWLAVVRRRRRASVIPGLLGTATRISAEALYSALGSQLGILIIYLIAVPSATTGIRLAYSVVFAPVFSLIQALTPLLLVHMSELGRGPASASGRSRAAARWVVAGLSGVVVSGVVGWAVAVTGLGGPNYAHTAAFLLPVGAALAGNLVLDTALLVIRFGARPSVPHRIRLIVVSIDLAAQLVLTLSFGLDGLVAALVGMAVLKAIAAGIAIRASTATTPEQERIAE